MVNLLVMSMLSILWIGLLLIDENYFEACLIFFYDFVVSGAVLQ